MLPIDLGDDPDNVPPAPPLLDILPAQAMARGGTIIRPGAVAWGGPRDVRDEESASCEAIEGTLTSVAANPALLRGLLAELTRTRLWVPLPARKRPFTDGTAVRLPVVGYEGTDFVPCFTSVQRLRAWADASAASPGADRTADASRRWQRADDARVVPHIVVPAAGLAQRLPHGLGLALNPGSVPGLPLYPECVSYLARTTPGTTGTSAEVRHPPVEVRHPPVEPATLLREASAALGALPPVRAASRAWLSVPGQGEGLVIAVFLDDPASEPARLAVVAALEQAATRAPLRVPFPVDVTFPGESAPDVIDEWVTRNTRPFFTNHERPNCRARHDPPVTQAQRSVRASIRPESGGTQV